MSEIYRKNIVILGAGGRDFHNFNTLFKDNPNVKVKAFVMAQIPYQSGKLYPPELAGKNYPNGIPMIDELELKEFLKKERVDEAILAYSDLTYEEVMKLASMLLTVGIDFRMVSPGSTMLKSSKPVIAITGIKTGVGKSTVTRFVARLLTKMGFKISIVRHPMSYGNLKEKAVLHFSKPEEVISNNLLSTEERGEYLSLTNSGFSVYSGIDYKMVLEKAEMGSDIILWDGGNNDTPFIKPDVHITVVDATRPEIVGITYPGTINLTLADIVIVTKVDRASESQLSKVLTKVKEFNKEAKIVLGRMPISVKDPKLIKGKKVLVVEDGPTVTHGGLTYGSAYIAAKKHGAREIVDPKPYSIGSIRKVYEEYPNLENILPSLGYSYEQLNDLIETVKRVPSETIVYDFMTGIGDLLSEIRPATSVSYELVEEGPERVESMIAQKLRSKGLLQSR